jgi:transcriptional regulator with XRE-family HTH domain
LRMLREGRGLRQVDVCRALGWPSVHLSRLETGVRSVRLDHLRLLLDLYAVPDDLRDDLVTPARRARALRCAGVSRSPG